MLSEMGHKIVLVYDIPFLYRINLVSYLSVLQESFLEIITIYMLTPNKSFVKLVPKHGFTP